MDTVGLGFCFEDLPLGRQFKTVGRTVTEADIVGFIDKIGMTEVLFTNLDFLRNVAGFEGRLAPGSMVFCFAEGLLAQATMQGTGLAFLGMQLDIKGPTFAGDTIHVECEVTEHRPASKGERGLVRFANKVVNQRGETVLEYNPLRLLKKT